MKFAGLFKITSGLISKNLERAESVEKEDIIKIANEIGEKISDILSILNKHQNKPFLIMLITFLLEILLKYYEKKENKRGRPKNNVDETN